MSGNYRAYIVPLAVLLVIFGFMQFQFNQRLNHGLDELSLLQDRNDEIGRQSARLSAEIAELEEELTALRSALDEAIEQPPRPRLSLTSEGLKADDSVPAASPTGAPIGEPEPNFNERFRERLRTPEVRAHMAESTVQSQYGAFIKSLKLSAEDEEALVKLMEEVAYEQLYVRQRHADGELSRAEYARLSDPNLMARTLRDFLTQDEMEAFERYQADAPVRTQASLQANQYVMLGNGAPGLTDTNRAHVATVLADVMTSPRAQAAMQNGDGLTQIHEMAEGRLQSTLDAEQLKIVSDFLARQRERRELLGP